jgi:hypothetical protein
MSQKVEDWGLRKEMKKDGKSDNKKNGYKLECQKENLASIKLETYL